jgi:hypothetical protein
MPARRSRPGAEVDAPARRSIGHTTEDELEALEARQPEAVEARWCGRARRIEAAAARGQGRRGRGRRSRARSAAARDRAEPLLELRAQRHRETTIALHEAAKERYLNYALSVITSRALPDVRDGLKPVQRRKGCSPV